MLFAYRRSPVLVSQGTLGVFDRWGYENGSIPERAHRTVLAPLLNVRCTHAVRLRLTIARAVTCSPRFTFGLPLLVLCLVFLLVSEVIEYRSKYLLDGIDFASYFASKHHTGFLTFYRLSEHLFGCLVFEGDVIEHAVQHVV